MAVVFWGVGVESLSSGATGAMNFLTTVSFLSLVCFCACAEAGILATVAHQSPIRPVEPGVKSGFGCRG